MALSEPLYCCSLCDFILPADSKVYTLPGRSESGRTFCNDCWIWIYNLSICWTCGEIVGRGEEKVGFGWCWWHWGCLACMTCKAPLKPPPWTENPNGVELLEPPLCTPCNKELDIGRQSRREQEEELILPSSKHPQQSHTPSAYKLKRVVSFGRDRELLRSAKRARMEDGPSPNRRRPKRKKVHKEGLVHQELDIPEVEEGPAPKQTLSTSKLTHVSINDPLNPTEAFSPAPTRPLPKWMSLLPSNRQAEDLRADRITPSPVSLPIKSAPASLFPEPLVISRNGKAVPIKLSGKDASKLFFTPGYLRAKSNLLADGLSTPRVRSQSVPATPSPRRQSLQHPERSRTPSNPSPYPFFQNPRAPFSPSKESSWTDIRSHLRSPHNGNEASFLSTEYVDKYTITPQLPPRDQCPICEETILVTMSVTSSATRPIERKRKPGTTTAPAAARIEMQIPEDVVSTVTGTLYHVACLRCRVCRLPFLAEESIRDWAFVGAGSAYHRYCLIEGTRPILERLKRRLSLHGGGTTVSPGSFSRRNSNKEGSLVRGISKSSNHAQQSPRPSMDVIVEGGIKKQDPVRRRGSLFTSKGGGTSKTQQVEFEDGKGSQMRRKQVPSATQSAPGVVGKVDQEPICAACGLPVEVDQDVLPGQWGGWIHDGCRKG